MRSLPKILSLRVLHGSFSLFFPKDNDPTETLRRENAQGPCLGQFLAERLPADLNLLATEFYWISLPDLLSFTLLGKGQKNLRQIISNVITNPGCISAEWLGQSKEKNHNIKLQNGSPGKVWFLFGRPCIESQEMFASSNARLPSCSLLPDFVHVLAHSCCICVLVVRALRRSWEKGTTHHLLLEWVNFLCQKKWGPTKEIFRW